MPGWVGRGDLECLLGVFFEEFFWVGGGEVESDRIDEGKVITFLAFHLFEVGLVLGLLIDLLRPASYQI